jgi:hypothetical protein
LFLVCPRSGSALCLAGHIKEGIGR